tara:strand:+ start:632 stop:733 length:102 start_codon:yes stop_codon:yes gene_type:complete
VMLEQLTLVEVEVETLVVEITHRLVMVVQVDQA